MMAPGVLDWAQGQEPSPVNQEVIVSPIVTQDTNATNNFLL